MILGSEDLNVGSIHYKGVFADSSSAVIYKQKPNPYEAIRIGEAIDVFLIQELPYGVEKCKKDSTDF